MEFEDRLSLAGMGLLAVGLFAALLTWLCVGWFGNQPLLTALVAVVLVEVFLASFGLIALLLTERITITALKSERRQPPAPRPQPKKEPIWYRLPDPVVPPQHAPPSDDRPATIAFPTPANESESHDGDWRSRAA